MNTLIGLIIIAIGSFGQSSSYVPINKVKNWSWESFWLVQGIFAWLVFPLLGALLAVPAESSLMDLWSSGGAVPAMVYGVLWGVGGLTFGLSMRYLGVALGQSIALGTCAGFGTLFPAIFAGKDLFHGDGLMLLIGVCITLAGIAIIGYAGSLRSKNMTEEEKKAAVKDFALTKGLLVALLAGVMSACFALGLDAGTPIKEAALANGVEALYAGLPVIFLVTLGGFFTNAVYCIQQNIKNKTGKEYFSVKSGQLVALLAGVMSACFALGLDAGTPIKEAALANGVEALYAGLPVIFLVTLGGFFTNAVYCIQQNIKNKTCKEYFSVKSGQLVNNLLFCALAGVLWYSQFFGLEMGKSFLTESPVLLAFSWSILMSLNVTFSNVWGILLKEWKGVSNSTIGVLILGLIVLISSIIVVAMAQA